MDEDTGDTSEEDLTGGFEIVSDSGDSMRKSFLQSPVKSTSDRFSLVEESTERDAPTIVVHPALKEINPIYVQSTVSSR